MITLYTTNCSKCKIIEVKLDRAKIEFEKCNDIEVMKSKGITAVPCLEVNGVMFNFEQANSWVNKVGTNEQ